LTISKILKNRRIIDLNLEMFPGCSILVQLGLSYVLEHDEDTPIEKLDLLEATFKSYLTGFKSASQAGQIFRNTIGTSTPFNRVLSIIQTANTPIPDFSKSIPITQANRKRTRPWTDYESQRLLAAIYRFGTDDWASVASFVGNGRSRSQCSQRWMRGLNPAICKERWTPDEEEKLGRLVDKYGTKGWMKIAGEMGHRSDVQCRYHYNQMHRITEESAKPAARSIVGSISIPVGLMMAKQSDSSRKNVFPSIQDLLNPNRPWQTSVSLTNLPRIRAGRDREPTE
jgi:hypothetical protein